MNSNLALIPFFSAILVILVGKPFIDFLGQWRLKQSIRQEGPQSHLAKAGTPTMGGWLIVLSALVVALFFDRSPNTLALAALTLAYALLGFFDDFIGIAKKHNKGLSARAKMLGQLSIGVFFALYLGLSGRGTSLLLPFTHAQWEIGYFYYPLVLLVLVAATNAVNLTDGLDGLAGSTGAIAMGGLVALLSRYALHQEGAIIFLLAMAGGCLGFLWFNGHPAQVFMGDTGSLALGAALAGAALLGGLELFLIPIGFVFVAETLSVILQVVSFKRTGKRIFRMSPIHHHFELGGLKETKVVWRFGIAEGIAVLLTIGLM
ncbi:MAG TPA: phospho-N-acetylmuramoyl-pentapeptide-transferase [Cyanobacteria bacterium UBA8530]|nr:phospho-N-acetylmuramoyl-pentapeptide-transferase [Cyanobacteria bacterium UBA8530]